MRFYLAPLEGITSYVYRNAYHHHFRQMDKYFTPFLVPHINKKFSEREWKELSPEHNQGLFVVPQLLTNRADDFLKTAQDIKDMGYDEINLNLGCPSGTVVSKKKGAGFLAYPEELEMFLDEIFWKSDMKISIKTRIGKEDPAEFERLLHIYNKFPIHELIIHPRVQTDFYQNTPNISVFENAFHHSKLDICYNGDINSSNDLNRLLDDVSGIETVMIGRGIIRNPGLVHNIEGNKMSRETLKSFHDEIYAEYQIISSGEKNVLFKMKELWSYMIDLFEHNEKYYKAIKKSEKLSTYESVISNLFGSCDFKSDIGQGF